LSQVKSQIAHYAQEYQRNLADIRLLAVSKTQAASVIRQAFQLGQPSFGENYLQEALSKMEHLHDLTIDWHFIGPIQSNKTRDIAEHFDWVHSVDRIKIAERLSAQRPNGLPALNIFLQINLDHEPSKAGFTQDNILSAARTIAELPRLKLRGLMSIPAPRSNVIEQRSIFRKLITIQNELIEQGILMDQTSMGMSNDMQAAIAEGSNWLRIGSAIFGLRNK
jgi:pyridoxal phosphate enzyme (YggS family)